MSGRGAGGLQRVRRLARSERRLAVGHRGSGVRRPSCFLVGGRGSWGVGCSLIGHRLSSVSRLDGDVLVGRVLGWLVRLRLWRGCGLLRVALRGGGDHGGVSGGGYHRSWSAAGLVETAAGTDTAQDDDQNNGDEASDPQHQRHNGPVRIVFAPILFIF